MLACVHPEETAPPRAHRVGVVASVKEGEKTRNMFRVKINNKLPVDGFVQADPETPAYCWIKRQFLKSLAPAHIRNLTNGFIECRVTDSTPQWLRARLEFTP